MGCCPADQVTALWASGLLVLSYHLPGTETRTQVSWLPVLWDCEGHQCLSPAGSLEEAGKLLVLLILL